MKTPTPKARRMWAACRYGGILPFGICRTRRTAKSLSLPCERIIEELRERVAEVLSDLLDYGTIDEQAAAVLRVLGVNA